MTLGSNRLSTKVFQLPAVKVKSGGYSTLLNNSTVFISTGTSSADKTVSITFPLAIRRNKSLRITNRKEL